MIWRGVCPAVYQLIMGTSKNSIKAINGKDEKVRKSAVYME